MKQPKTLSYWDFPDIETIPDGYDSFSIPKATSINMQTLVEEHNNLVDVVNSLCRIVSIEFDE